MFRYVVLLPDRRPSDPPCLVTPVADPPVGAEISLGNGGRARVLRKEPALHTHLRALGFSGVLTVQPL